MTGHHFGTFIACIQPKYPFESYMMKMQNGFFQLVNEKIPLIASGTNKIYYAELKEYFNADAFRNFSVKIPLHGNITYTTANERYNLAPGQFLLARKQPGKVNISSDTTVKGLCFDIDQQTIDEVFTVLLNKGCDDIDGLQAGHFFSPAFFENSYHLNNTAIGVHLKGLIKGIIDRNVDITEETFLRLAEKIVQHELDNNRSMSGFKIIKLSTRKELLRRLLVAKELIDSSFLLNPTIGSVARECAMSVFHFYRNFKQAFHCTPYQYMLEKRLQFAMQLLLKKNRLIDVAKQCGFPDMATFCKAFKRKYGLSPTSYKKQEAMRYDHHLIDNRRLLMPAYNKEDDLEQSVIEERSSIYLSPFHSA